MLWIEAQSALVIAVLVFGVCYLLTAAIFCLAAIFSRRAVAQDLKAVVPVTLTPLGVILGLLIVFLASRVWMNFDRAGEYVGQEAGALRETILLAEFLPPGGQDECATGHPEARAYPGGRRMAGNGASAGKLAIDRRGSGGSIDCGAVV